jgi:predicted RNase H-like HicB family nuclease
MATALQLHLDLYATIKPDERGWYIAYCPPLDLASQGETEEIARKNIREAASLFLESCFERGTFEAAMRELGWQVTSGVARPPATEETLPSGAFQFSAPIPFSQV